MWYSVLASTDFRHGWAIFGPLEDKISRKGELVELPASEKFSGLFFNIIWHINLNLVGSATHQVRVSSQSGHPDQLYSQ